MDGQIEAALIQAIAAFVVGVAAVVAATIVGDRQVRIAAKQAEILDQQLLIQNHQSRIQHEQLRQNLFDRRYEVYHQIASAIDEVHSGPLPEGRLAKALMAVSKAQFLFSSDTHTELVTISNLIFKIDALRGLVGDEMMPQEERRETYDAMLRALIDVRERASNLSSVFSEMRMSDRLDALIPADVGC